MNTSSHTPGPWQFYADLPSADPNWHIVTNASRMRVLANVHIEPGNKIDAANARLIAAAPDSHAVCKELLAIFDRSDRGLHDFSTTEILDLLTHARAAVAKAEGQE